MTPRVLTHADRPFVACLLGIMVLGLYNLASAGKPLGVPLHYSHAAHLALGVAVALAVAAVPYRHLEAIAYPLFLGVVGLLLATTLFGKMVNGSRRWLVLGPLNLQTSDLAKLGVILIVARTLHHERWSGGLTLRQLFRPLNVSRPAVLLAAILGLSTFGTQLRPPKLEKWNRTRYRPVLTLRSSVDAVALGRRAVAPEGQRAVQVREAGVEGRHARIRRGDDGHWWVEDGGGDAPTTVNGLPIREPTSLAHGDVVQLGTSERARVRFVSPLEKAKPILPWFALMGVGWLVIALRHLMTRGKWSFEDLVAPIDVVLLPCALVLIQPDLGTTLVILLIAFSMVLYVGLRPSSLLILIGSGLGFGVVAWKFVLEAYQKERIFTFLDPEGDLAGAGYHQHQSLIAIGSGEVLGKGHGQGTQTQLSFLPEQQTDFIFSVWAEEQGFLGCCLVVLLFAGLILAALRVGQRARDRFGALLAVGVTAMLFWHTIVNMLMVLRLAPVVGVPLPLWSNGGSFVLTTMVGVGLVLNVSLRRTMF